MDRTILYKHSEHHSITDLKEDKLLFILHLDSTKNQTKQSQIIYPDNLASKQWIDVSTTNLNANTEHSNRPRNLLND